LDGNLKIKSMYLVPTWYSSISYDDNKVPIPNFKTESIITRAWQLKWQLARAELFDYLKTVSNVNPCDFYSDHAVPIIGPDAAKYKMFCFLTHSRIGLSDAFTLDMPSIEITYTNNIGSRRTFSNIVYF